MKQLFPFSKNNDIATKHIDSVIEYGFVNEAGAEILDLGLGSSGCFPLGFNRTDIIQSVCDKMKELPFNQSDFATTNKYVNQLSDKLSELSGGYNILYSLSGSDSVEGAIKIAQIYNPNRKTIIGMPNSYHGSTYMSASVSGSTYLTDTFGKHEDCKVYTDLSDIDSSVLAVIIETCSWQNGLIEYPHWKELRERCTMFGVLLIVDDIAFCNGKTGTFFGWQKLDIKPDIFCVGKGITGGYFPLSACMLTDEVANVVRPQVLLHGFSYSFSMSGIFSALEFIRIVEEDQLLEKHQLIVDNGIDVANRLVDEGLIKGYRNFGVCFSLLLNDAIPDLWDKEALFYKHGLHMGVWNSYKDGILVMLPLNASASYFDTLYKKLRLCFTELQS